MDKYNKHFVSLFLIVLLSCESAPESIPEINGSLTETERMLTGTWRYDYLNIGGNKYLKADPLMEISLLAEEAGNRADLFRRKIYYSPNKTYQLQWDERGDYELGTYGDPNWQPNFGYWEIRNEDAYQKRDGEYRPKSKFNISSR